jgi:fructose/tagatose bisphosphate aldolase
MISRTALDLLTRHKATFELSNGQSIVLKNHQKFVSQALDELVLNAVFADTEEVRGAARWIIRRAGLELGVVPSSLQGLYEARARKECKGFTVPAFNIRGLTYDVARAVFRAASRLRAGAFIFELSRTESHYTDQRPGEYAAVVIAAALREGFEGPVFIQGDHFQVNALKFARDPESELQSIRDFCQESVAAGYYNVDIDASTLVNGDAPGAHEQQRANFETTAALAAFLRSLEPPGITVALGGEIGEIGKQNSTPEELTSFVDGFLETLARRSRIKKGLAKISVQAGTKDGGVVLPDGGIAPVAIDFETLRALSAVARDRYGMAGTVQHGASTLPAEAFHKFVECEVAEVHLATEFQNMIYENPAFPKDLKEEIYKSLRKLCADERKVAESDAQFLYRTRKKAFGPFKRRFWDLPAEVRDRIGRDLEKKFGFLFEQLNVQRTAELVKKTVPLAPVIPPPPGALTEVFAKAGH